jgi:hypothetical protein
MRILLLTLAMGAAAVSVAWAAPPLPLSAVERVAIEPPSIAAALAADAARAPRPIPHRVAVPSPLVLDTSSAGTWEKLENGGSLWRLRVASPGAVFTSLKFSELELPAGAELRIYSAAAGDFVSGPFTARHNRAERRFGSPMIPGEEAVIELRLAPGSRDAALRLESVSHGFRDPLGFGAPPPLAPADFACQRDINCPEGAPYQNVKRAVAEGYDGAFICSGTMLDNTAQDNRYLYLTADHCEFWIDPPTMSYYWKYENSGCGNHNAPFMFSSGSTNLFRSAAADIHLLELDGTDIDDTYDIWFAGWSRLTTPPTRGAVISFPADKPKQIAIENDPITDCAPSGCFDGWGPNYWRVEGYDVGVTEGGSSGAGLLDRELRVVGTLTGGVGTDCDDFEWDEYAKLYPVWAGLAPFLDPLNTGAIAIPGRDHADFPAAPPVAEDMRLGRGILSTITVTYDAATCSADRAVMLWGPLGDFDGYQDDVGLACNLGNDGSASFPFPGTNVWFNLLWVNAGGEAGHPGFSSAGPRDWSAVGLCDVETDDVADATCD